MPETNQSKAASAEADIDAPTGLPVLPPLAALVEIVVLVVLPGLLDMFVPSFPSLNDTQPHVYWVPVLLLTLQYGSASGLLAAGVAIVLSSTLGWSEQDIGENHFNYLLRIWSQPVLWIATAVILGQLRLRQIERKQALGRSVTELAGQRQMLADHARQLRARCEQLELAIATRYETDAQGLLAALGRTQHASYPEAVSALHEAIGRAFGDARLSVHLLEDGHLRTVFRHGPADASSVGPLTPQSKLYEAVVQRGLALNILDPSSEDMLAAQGLAAVPVFGAGRSVIGAVVLESCDPSHLDTSTLDRLAAIAGLIAARHQREPMRREEVRTDNRPPSPDAPAIDRSREPRWRRARRRGDRLVPALTRPGRKA
ncbi:MAG: GAF domain-containing protein [Hyphomicrobiaceae bacterium]